MAGRKGMKSSKATALPKRLRPGGLRTLDGRSAVFRELHDEYAALSEQYGGEEHLTPVERNLIESLVFTNAWRRRLEGEAVKSGALDVQRYVALVDRVHGIARTLGLKRQAKPAESLQQYMARKATEGQS